MHRGNITECRYVPPRKYDRCLGATESLGLPEDVQRKIDHLKSLVQSLMRNHRNAQGGGTNLSVPTLVEESRFFDHQTSFEYQVAHQQLGHVDFDTVPNAVGSGPTMKIDATYGRHRSIDEAHWALLLSEVRSPSTHQTILISTLDQRSAHISS